MDILKSDLFTPLTDPESGVTIYILSRKIAPVQENFYFVNDPMDAAARYWWFYCAFPPSGTQSQGRTLGVLDVETGDIRHFPETQFSHASPFVEPETGWVYWGMGDSVYKRGPHPGDEYQLVGRLPEDLVRRRYVNRLATHLTRSADGKELFVDSAIAYDWVFGSMTIKTGDFQVWHTFNRNHNHAQFSPTDSDEVLFAQDFHVDPVTGQHFPSSNRMWLMRRGEEPRPVFPERTMVNHEWWDHDGEHVWCIVIYKDTWRVNIKTREIEKLGWPDGAWHSHHHTSGKYVVGDANNAIPFYRGCPSTVHFLNRETGKSIRLADNPEMPGIIGALYHIDPHPRFSGGERFVTFTTTVRGEVDFAVVPTEDLIAQTS